MLIVDNPLKLLYIALGILIFFLLLFKVINFLENIKVKSKTKKESKPSVKSETKSESKETKTDSESVVMEKATTDDVVIDSKNMSNYLYDRFVTNPTVDDQVHQKANIPNYITQENADEIKNAKVKIDVTPIKEPLTLESYTMHKVIENNAKSLEQKEKLLAEFDSMPKSMKLLLIENIMKGID